MEIELKLTVSTADVQRIMLENRLEGLVTAGPSTAQLVAGYFDTDDFDLRQHGLSLRVRTDGRRTVQTLKSAGNGGVGATVRAEWEMPVAGPDPELESLQQLEGLPPKIARLLGDLCQRAKLREQFRVDVKRKTWQLRAGAARVEMALDEGWISCGEDRTPVSELELELKSGDKAALYEVAKEVASQIPVQPGGMSKGARGYALCRGETPGPARAARIALSSKLSVDDGIHAVLGACLQQALSNVRGILESDDPEYVHQMRVGLRRWCSATKLFREWIVLPAPILDGLEWLGAVLGGARDHDVLAISTLPTIREGLLPADDLQPLLERARALAGEKRAELRQALHSQRFGEWMLLLVEWIDGRHWNDELDAAQRSALYEPLVRFARRAVARGHAKVEKRGKKLATHDGEQLHRLRIACKQNRYAAEFFRGLERSRSEKYIRELSALQDMLGVRNDVAVARGIVSELQQDAPELAGAAGLAAGYLACRGNAPLGDTCRHWKSFIARSPGKLFH